MKRFDLDRSGAWATRDDSQPAIRAWHIQSDTSQCDVPADQPVCLVLDEYSTISPSTDGSGTFASGGLQLFGQLIVWLVAAISIGGCGSRDMSAKYAPNADVARQSLEAALDAWKRGEPPATVQGASTGIEVADSKRRTGQTLANYEILGEVPGDGPRRFSVRLNLGSPSQEVQTQYIVVGRDPIWVFSEEDYAQPKGM